MKKIFKVAFFATPLIAMGILANAQPFTRSRTAALLGVINTSPINLSQFQVEGALITQNSFNAPVAANFTGSFSTTARWNSMGNLNAGTQTLNGFRTQTNGRGLATGYSVANVGGALSNPFIQWIGNAVSGVTPGALEFKFAVNPGGVGAPAPDVTLFKMAPTTAGTSGDSYAQNGILGHLQTGTFGDISGPSQWLGHGPARIAGVLDPTIYGNRIQQGAQSMLFNLVSSKPVVGWGDQGQDMVFRYFSNRFNPALFDDVLTLQSSGRSNFGPAFTTDAKVIIRGLNESIGLDIVTKSNGPNSTHIGGNALCITGPKINIGFRGTAQGNGENYGIFGFGSSSTYNVGTYGEADPNTNFSSNYGVFGYCPPSAVAAFTAGGYFIGGLYADGVVVMSDQKLKSNVINEDNITSKIMQLRPVSYQLDQKRKGYSFSNKLQHGFIAQEMEKVFPELVTSIKHPIKDGDNTTFEDIKGVNYVGLISVLTRGMQEQEDKITAMEKEMQVLKQTVQALATNNPAAKSALNNSALAGYELKQNLPNPFTESTVISYSIPATEKNASIAIFDLNGRMLTQYSNLVGKAQLTISAKGLQPGIYIYSLIAGGQELLSKRMVVTQ
jgi:Chaperone of endosialidase/Secretion system C-terminal sorting domain